MAQDKDKRWGIQNKVISRGFQYNARDFWFADKLIDFATRTGYENSVKLYISHNSLSAT